MSRWRRRKGQIFQPSDFLGIHRRIDRPERTVSLQPASVVWLNQLLNVINTRARHYSYPYSFVDVSVLQLHKSCTNCGYVRLLITERHTSSSLRILQFRVNVDSGIANASVESVHNQGQFDCKRKQKWTTMRKRSNDKNEREREKKIWKGKMIVFLRKDRLIDRSQMRLVPTRFQRTGYSANKDCFARVERQRSV